MKEKKPTKIIMVDYPEDDICIQNEFICTKVEETKFEKRVFLEGKYNWIRKNTIKHDANYTNSAEVKK